MKKKRRKIMWIIIVSILGTGILSVVLFLNLSPQFGGKAGKSEKKIWAKKVICQSNWKSTVHSYLFPGALKKQT